MNVPANNLSLMSETIDPKQRIKKSYDTQADRYSDEVQMQSGNLGRLLDLANRYMAPARSKLHILDAGCGFGIAVPSLRERPEFSFTSYCGIDLSHQMITKAAENFESDNIKFKVMDLEAFDLPDATFNFVVSNSVLHWLNQPKFGQTINKAITELYRTTAPGGLLALSVAGVGTSRNFNRAYQQTMTELRLTNDHKFITDPVGCMQLADVVDAVLNSGYGVQFAALEYEPVVFSSPEYYANAVRAYGYEMFTAHVPTGEQETTWNKIVTRFSNGQPPGAYNHDQYMVYLIAKKSG